MKWLAALLLLPVAVCATNGMEQIGAGAKSRAMGGVGVAYPQDAFASMLNPAGMGLLCRRFDVGVSALRHSGRAELVPEEYASTHRWMVWPEASVAYPINRCNTVGLAAFVDGQWRADFGKPVSPYGTSDLGTNFGQFFITPSWALRVAPCHWVGVALNAVGGWFSADGLQHFVPASTDPTAVTNRGTDWTGGASVRVGWLCTAAQCIHFGLTYRTQSWTAKFDNYSGLLTDHGKLETPPQLGFGFVWFKDCCAVSCDVVKIWWRSVTTFHNDLTEENDDRFGAVDGPGFGWDDQLVLKLGIAWDIRPCLTLRIGYNHGNTVLPGAETYINVLNMQGVENHLTLGVTWATCLGELSALYVHAFRHTAAGTSPPLERVTIVNRQNTFGLSFGRPF